MTKYTLTQASNIVGKGRTTLNRHIKEGRLTVEKNDQGHKVLDASELLRVYGSSLDFESADAKSGNKRTVNSGKPDDCALEELREVSERELRRADNHIARLERDMEEMK